MSIGRAGDKQGRASDEPLGPSSSELLDLVRSAEDDARLALRKRTPAVATVVSKLPSDAAPVEEVVEVGDDAVDLPPSHPPIRAATPAAAFAASVRRPRETAAARPSSAAAGDEEDDALRVLPPALGIALMFALAVLALALLAR